MKYYVGIDVGGTFVKCGIVTETGEIVIKDKIPTGKDRDYRAIVSDISSFVKDLADRAGLSFMQIVAIGGGVPGTIDSRDGIVVYSNNIRWKNIPLGKALQESLQKPVFLTNDANAAALGENFCGAGRAYQTMIFVTLGTGVGGGIVLNGQLYEGNFSAGAEIGHDVIRFGGEKCTCGRRGCFEAYASATALIRQTCRAMEKDKNSILWQICKGDLQLVDGKTAFDGAEAGDKTARRVVDRYIRYLSEGIANLVNVFRPQAIVLGGGVCAQGESLIGPLRKRVSRMAYGGFGYAPTEIVTASLGNDAGLCGAARLAMLKSD